MHTCLTMPTFDLYCFPHCVDCETLKEELHRRKIPFSTHDVSSSATELTSMKMLTEGIVHFPVLVVDKDTEHMRVAAGLEDAKWLLGEVR